LRFGSRASADADFDEWRDDGLVPVICPTCQNVFRGTFKAQNAEFVTLHGVVFDILVLERARAGRHVIPGGLPRRFAIA
jgi:hypothetical protein